MIAGNSITLEKVFSRTPNLEFLKPQMNRKKPCGRELRNSMLALVQPKHQDALKLRPLDLGLESQSSNTPNRCSFLQGSTFGCESSLPKTDLGFWPLYPEL